MKAEYGKLDVSKRYSLVDVEYLGEGMYWYCENCENTINSVAFVKDDEGNIYKIGLDCMTVLTNMKPDEQKEAKKRMNRLKRIARFLKKECKSIIVMDDTCYLYGYITTFWSMGYKYVVKKALLDKMIEKVKADIMIIHVKLN